MARKPLSGDDKTTKHDLEQCIHLVGQLQRVREECGHGEVIFTLADGVVVKATTMVRYQRKA